jgi:hypothetical protein
MHLQGVADPGFEAPLTYMQESRCVNFRGYKRTSLYGESRCLAVTDSGSFAAYQPRLSPIQASSIGV